MTAGPKPVHTGGCQCGAVRYALHAEPRNAHICHCRMCQKAFGGFFAPLASVDLGELEWTRGRPALFASSTIAERGFCAACGTPLTFRYPEKGHIAIALGSLDDPARVRPVRQYGIESRMPWFAKLPGLPGTATEDDMPADILARCVSAQHPDHEVADDNG